MLLPDTTGAAFDSSSLVRSQFLMLNHLVAAVFAEFVWEKNQHDRGLGGTEMFEMCARGWDTDPTLVSPVLQAGVATPQPKDGQEHRKLFPFQFCVVFLPCGCSCSPPQT